MVKRRILSHLKLCKDVYAEIKKVRGVRRVTSAYIILGTVYHVAVYVMPQLGDAVTRAPKLNALLSWRSWIILALVLLIIFIVDGAQRVQRRKLKAQGKRNRTDVAQKQDHIEDLEKRAAELLAGPKLTGFFQDASSTYMFSKPEPEVENELTKIGRPLSPTGTTITIFFRMVNENPTPTTLHNFSLEAETRGKKVLARYPEEQTKRTPLE